MVSLNSGNIGSQIPEMVARFEWNIQFKDLLNHLPENHKTRWFAGAALNTSDQSMQSIMSTALARLNTFIDSELEILWEEPDSNGIISGWSSEYIRVYKEVANEKHGNISKVVGLKKYKDGIWSK